MAARPRQCDGARRCARVAKENIRFALAARFEGLTTFRSHPGALKQVLIIISSVGIRQKRISSLAPVASVPIAVRYQDNGDDMVRMHFT
ncbi:hypothetical protein E3N88_40569 [Mikania micrantha]|uniref:Uncharacterized protein n=1 Tax=Mikania micrantha TaxID=192012 RepID=A0A5N6LMY3_9ASTR|nr:hypothetical protein E3N88_40569 [Mikania micrantha]